MSNSDYFPNSFLFLTKSLSKENAYRDRAITIF